MVNRSHIKDASLLMKKLFVIFAVNLSKAMLHVALISHMFILKRVKKCFRIGINTSSEESLNLMVIWEKYLNLLCTHIIVKLAAFLVGK